MEQVCFQSMILIFKSVTVRAAAHWQAAYGMQAPDSVARPDKHPSSPLAGLGGVINGVFCAVLLGVAALLMGPLISLTFVGLMRPGALKPPRRGTH